MILTTDNSYDQVLFLGDSSDQIYEHFIQFIYE